MNYRDRIVQAMTKKKLFPADYSLYPEDDTTQTLADGGLYPDIEDPKFVSRLLKKSEFADTISRKQTAASANPCEAGPGFEVTPVQRFVANFLHPRTPYMSMLLYHGVGVGKTCAAIQTAEAYLDVYPRRKVLIVVPKTIRQGFIRTIFDMDKLILGSGNTPNTATDCTGDVYLKLSGCLFERDITLIEKRITRVINQRYAFFGYGQFKNYIRNVTKKIPIGPNQEENELRIATALKNEFNYRLLIIDEAHNLRDIAATATTTAGDEDDEEESNIESNPDAEAVANQQQPAEEEEPTDADEAKAGKELTPFLKQLLRSTDGMKLLCMTATPMFNSVFEIVFLLNLMLMNDKKAEVSTDKLLGTNGEISGEPARRLFRRLANAYISFMRGENPDSFPIRLFPEGELRDGEPIVRVTSANYPRFALANEKGQTQPTEVRRDEIVGMSKLPLVKSSGEEFGQFDTLLRKLTEKKVAEGGTGYQVVDSLLQAGNCMFPLDEDPETSEPERFFGNRGFQEVFTPVPNGKGAVRCTTDASWLSLENFGDYSPKGAMILNSLQNAEGVCFVYSRFVTVGAFLLALALEANGYSPYGRESGARFLADGIQSEGGRQCALCNKREHFHSGEAHTFKPAFYTLLTGDQTLTPKKAEAIKIARSKQNVNGEIIKVVIGSQVAAEGVDLRFIREVHIFDAWFHLNKTEQIIGRGIRFCSHSLLEPASKRNTTIFLHVTTFADDKEYRETADLYCYRKALEKAVLTGKVSRELKIGAIDCNLRKDVTVITGLKNRIQLDSQGQSRKGNDPNNPGISVNDTDFTAMCDWMGCSYVCDPNVTVDPKTSDESTYDSFSARFRESKIQQIIKQLFAEQPFFEKGEFIQALMIRSQAPKPAILMSIQSIVNNRTFHVQVGPHQGYIIYKNGLFLFQPDAYKDTSIPLALRIAEWPVKRDEYEPASIKFDIEQPLVKPTKKTGEAGESNNNDVLSVQEIQPRNEFWAALIKWTDDCVHNRITKVEGTEIERSIEKYTETNKDQRKLYLDKLAGILFVNKRVADKTKLKEAILEYFWDEWIHPVEQVRMLLDNIPGTAEVGSEQLMRDKTIRAIRHINAESNTLDFTCEGGQVCPRGITDAFMGRPASVDPVKTRNADEDHAGVLYGFMVPKRGMMVFKTNIPHNVGGSVNIRRGQECGIVTAASQSQEHLLTIGKELARIGVPTMDLTVSGLRSAQDFKQGCTILNIVLRILDKEHAGGKYWFFRPVAAFYSGHRGMQSDTAKASDKEAAKLLKKQEAEMKKPQIKTVVKKTVAPPKKKAVIVQPPVAQPVPAPAPTKKRTVVIQPPVPVQAPVVQPPVVQLPITIQQIPEEETESLSNNSEGLSPISMKSMKSSESLSNNEEAGQAAERAAAERAAAERAAAERAAERAAEQAAAERAAAERAAEQAAAERAAAERAVVPPPEPAPAPAAPPKKKLPPPIATGAPKIVRKVVKNTEE